MDSTADFDLPRFIFNCDLGRVPQYRFDVLVLGAGAAGGEAAIAAAESGASVGLLTKAELTESNTRYAQGGMAAVLGQDDAFENHVQDTLRVGCGLAHREVAERVVAQGPQAVQDLLAFGAVLDRGPDGELELSREGGHSRHRIVHARGDATGIEIQKSITRAVMECPGITTFERVFAIDLLSCPQGSVGGALCRTERGELVAFLAKQTILATGGAGQIYRETTNPTIATADGVAMAVRAGAVVRDMEFIQFHPTCLYIAGAARVLISEIVRGAGGVLRDRHGVRFMPDYHEAAELAPRDVVSRAVFERMVASGDTSAYLDLSELDRDPHVAFPGISSICQFFGIDIARDPIPVRPGCHYMIGGLRVDQDGRTSLRGLWAAGEVASSGLHGANRMGSNSLLEALVLGRATGQAAATAAAEQRSELSMPPVASGAIPAAPPVQVNVDDLIYSLKSLMWRALGVVREGPLMEDALEKLRFWSRAVSDLPLDRPREWEFSNMLGVAQLITLGALGREESRGVHHRVDHPSRRESWQAHLDLEPLETGDGVRGLNLVCTPLRQALGAS